MERRNLYLLSISLGFFWGGLMSYLIFPSFFLSSPLSIIPWGLTSVVLGYFAANYKNAAVASLIYGITLSCCFMIPSLNFDVGAGAFALLLIICVISSAGSLIGSTLGYFSRKLFSNVRN